MCSSSTGAGKTLAYGIPIAEFLKTRPFVKKMPLRRGMAEPTVLILAPTHELAIEIHETMLALCWTDKTRCVLVYGGPPMKCQLDKLHQGCDVLIATPGRLLSLLGRGVLGGRVSLSLSQLQFIVYDEADELMSMSNNEMTWKESNQKHVYHWFFSSQYSDEQKERAIGFMIRVEGELYAEIDFNLPSEDESQRYTLVEQKFVEFGKKDDEKLSNTQQKMQYLQENHFASPQDGKTLILVRRVKDVDMIDYYLMEKVKV
ncbi:hypothetical protein IMSHALPRED_007268 [Imshaugia aleurites]|uniref:RNA helicase n=1 Tax=Imshaugia aleurites TaxID=172621 RepID=A0A8H3FNB1_9LECA|nr:hypothetical protein IMSHALPRED_007268 [Imshaugia aleurites]